MGATETAGCRPNVGVRVGMSPLPGGRQHCVIPCGIVTVNVYSLDSYLLTCLCIRN